MARFCTKCGRPLQEGEVCNCTAQNAGAQQNSQQNYQQQAGRQQYYQQQAGQQNYQQQAGQQSYQQQAGQQSYQQQAGYQQGQAGQQGPQAGMTKEAEWLNRQKDVIMAGTKNMFSEIGPIFKSPVSTAKRLASSNKAIIGIELIVAKAVICLIVMIIAMFVFQGKLEDLAFGAEVEMPWLKTIITVILMTAGVDFLEALIMKLITGAFNGRTHFTAMVNVIGERAIFDTIIFVIYMILMLLSFKVSLGFNMLFSSITVFIQFSAYRGCVSMNEDRKPYAYFIAKFCVAIISALVVYLIFKDTIDAFLKIMDTAEGFLNGSFF